MDWLALEAQPSGVSFLRCLKRRAGELPSASQARLMLIYGCCASLASWGRSFWKGFLAADAGSCILGAPSPAGVLCTLPLHPGWRGKGQPACPAGLSLLPGAWPCGTWAWPSTTPSFCRLAALRLLQLPVFPPASIARPSLLHPVSAPRPAQLPLALSLLTLSHM